MLNFFKKKTKSEKLELLYKKTMEEAYRLSTINRVESDNKYAEANNIMIEIEKIKNNL